jgi:broad specificity phosphatase PhoE
MSHQTAIRWPARLWIVRHGQSAGNVARDAANSAGLDRIDITARDVDVPLSPLGERQADALARWFGAMEPDCQPTAILASPYVRAIQTAAAIRARVGGDDIPLRSDERAREKEFGILNRLTRAGIERAYPEEAALRDAIGKFYYRPPAGESWCDVILRLRSLLDTISLHHSGPDKRVLIVAHQVVVLCLRYLLEELDEAKILAIDSAAEVANCGVTEYQLAPPDHQSLISGSQLQLVRYNFVAPLEEEGAPVTTTPDTPAKA